MMVDQSRCFCRIRGGQAIDPSGKPTGFPGLSPLFGRETTVFSTCSMAQSRSLTGTLWGVPTGYIV
jgi:hypothetical protein